MKMFNDYISNVKNIIENIENSKDIICKAGHIIAESYVNEAMLHVFGTGHSHMLGLEMFYRAGGLVRVNPIICQDLMLHISASKSSLLERREGLAEEILSRYQVKRGDVMIVFSNSGRNAVPVDIAELCKAKGVSVIALTNLNQSTNSTSRAKSGKKLYEVADIVIDNFGSAGDACVKLEDSSKLIGPTSTVAGAIIVNLILIETVDCMNKMGYECEVFVSSNVDGGDKINEAFINKYKDKISIL